ncbi:TIGR00725 family protein [Hamadaea tsunoensis]|uniref:TIGR00725 family protein n=1 Tax=Hamadaea tsunoensis TaxID=53368 RepID=UPI00040A4A7B|nr:TIGR00725 family protein [Hamadaea tsunoensis]
MPLQVAVCGPSACTPAEAEAARTIGRLLADAGAIVICGGGPGVMEAVTEGARSHNGFVIGVRPGGDKEDAAPDLSAVIVTNLGEARNAIIVRSGDVVIVVGGSWGTLSEVALAIRGGTPVVSLGGWRMTDAAGDPVTGVVEVATPEEAVEVAVRLARP